VPDHLRIRIRPDWDATLTYNALDKSADDSSDDPIFVGRDELIGPLVTEIAGVEKRGTYLISGYRGSGKTTLLIAALLRAKNVLTGRKQTLFPLVLNVSEISASLGSPSPRLGQDAAKASSTLQVDPRRLLTALLRAVNQRLPLLPSEKHETLRKLSERAAFAYRKATASKFAETATQAQESVRSTARALALATEDKNVLKIVAWAAGCAAIALEGVARFGTVIGWLHAGAAALAGVAALSVTASLKLERSQRRTDARQLAIEHDNSLQQLETDLKDMLVDLQDAGLRTVVVMEELDKIEDESGEQLDAVIKYFKNLFTQAPALFFFVTDRKYFDVVSKKIREARRERSYAIQHTFFTHRIFVGRPTTQECLQFIRAATLDESDRQAIDRAASTLGKPATTPQGEIELGQWLRVVLFRAANHLFDLKNELRRYVEEADNQRYFGIDGNRLPEQVAPLAKFQDLIEFKRVTYEIKGGRAYANEVLNDCLYAVFNELGASRAQKATDFLPSSDPGSSGAEQLDPSEVDRVRDAVISLIGDLERGRAFASRDRADNSFAWRPDAAKAFSYVRQLEPHEEALLSELSRQAALLIAISDEMKGLSSWEQFTGWSAEIDQRIRDLREAKTEPLSRDAATDEMRALQERYGRWFDGLNSGLVGHLSQHFGFVLSPVSSGIGGGLNYVQPPTGDPRYMPTTPRGGVLLAYGQTDQQVEDLWSFVNPQAQPSIFPLDRVGVVHVIHAAGNIKAAEAECRQRWEQSRIARSGLPPGFALEVDVVVLTATEDGPALPNRGARVAAGIFALGYWSQPAFRPSPPLFRMAPRIGGHMGAISEWLHSGSAVLELPSGDLASDSSTRPFDERDRLESALHASLVDGLIVPPGPLGESTARELARLSTSMFQYGDPAWDAIGNWMLQTRRVVLWLNLPFDPVEPLIREIETQLTSGAKLILVRDKRSSLPQLESLLTNVSVQQGYPASAREEMRT
jgi:hypothetical protein